MPIRKGSGGNLSNIYLGSQAVQKVYKGSQQVWPTVPGGNTTITHGSITYTFQGSVTYGYYETGEPWVVAPATLLSISPGYAVAPDGRDVNGAQLNPQFNDTNIALDGHFSGYSAANRMTFPANLSAGDVVVKAIGASDVSTELLTRAGVFTNVSALFVRSTAPAGKRAAPAPFGWAGRGEPQDYPFDPATFLAGITSRDTSAHTHEPTFQYFQDTILRYNLSAAATIGPTWGGGAMGYEPMSTRGFTKGATNYGRYQAATLGAAALALASNSFTTAQKKDILRALVRYGIGIYDTRKGASISDGGNGGHFQFIGLPARIALSATGRDAEVNQLPTWCKPNFAQYFQFDQPLLNRLAPHSNATDPHPYYLHTITAVNGDQITLSEPPYRPSHYKVKELEMVRQSDGASIVIPDGTDFTPGNSITPTIPGHPFAVNDVVYMRTQHSMQVGWVDWLLTSVQDFRIYNPSPYTVYRGLNFLGDDILAVRALGLYDPIYDVIEKYVAMAAQGPITGQYDYPSPFDSMPAGGNWAQEWWDSYAAIMGIDTTYKQVSSATNPPQFPTVTGSARFPEQNNWSSDASDAGIYQQSTTGLSNWWQDNSVMFITAHWPKSCRANKLTNRSFGLLGSYGNSPRTFQIYAVPMNHYSTSNRGKIQMRIRGSGSANQQLITGPIIPEFVENLLVVCERKASGANSVFTIKVWDTDTGVLYTGTPLTIDSATLGTITTSARTSFSVGANVDNTLNNAAPDTWPGSIAHVGHADALPTDAQWLQIVNGDDPLNVITPSTFKWYRRLDGSSTIQPGTATDQLPAMSTYSNATHVSKGSDFIKQTPTHWIKPNTIDNGHVFGVKATDITQGIATFSGSSSGYTGSIEVRVLQQSDDSVIQNWTTLGTIQADGTWNGSVTLPRSTGGWLYAQFRAANTPGDVAEIRERFAVGYKIAYLGQSQLEIWSNRKGLGITPATSNSGILENQDTYVELRGITTPYPVSDGIATFVDRFRAELNTRGDALTPVMLVDWARSGTAMMELIDDTNPGRNWADLQKTLDRYGNDYTLVLHQWGTSDKQNADFDKILEALVHGTGPRAKDHNLDAALQPGYKFLLQPLTRHSNDDTQTLRAQNLGVSFAHAFNHPIGVPMSDWKISDPGGPHPHDAHDKANPRLGRRLADSAMIALGFKTRALPYFDAAGTTSTATTVTIPVVTTGSGTVDALAPLRSWTLNGSYIASSNVSYDSVNKKVVITGTFASGDVITLNPNGETRTNGDGAAEDAIIDGFLHEDQWPIVGMHDATGKWVPEYTYTV